MQKRQATIVTIMVLILLVLVGCGKKEINQEVEEKIIPVQTKVAEKGHISESIKLSGTITPNKEINVIASMGGKVEKVYVQVGQVVKKGATLIKIDSIEVERQLNQALEGLKSAEAGLKVSEITIEPVRNAFIKAKEDYELAKNTVKMGPENEATLKIIENAFTQARLQYIQATGDPEAPKSLRKTSLQAEMGVKQAQSSVQALKTQLNNTRFSSPIKGLIAQANISVGNMAAPSVPMIKVIDIDKVILTINVPETRVSNLEDGQEISVEIGSLKETLVGKITSISPQADQMTKDFPVKITIENSNHLIKPGMTATAIIPVEEQTEVVLISKQALLNKDGIEKIFIVIDSNIAVEQTVKTGLRDDERIEIVSGIKEGDVVVVKGQHSLKNNSKVKIND